MNLPIEDRIALQDQMTAYCYAVDKLENVEELLDLFTDDAVLDFSAIGLPAMPGKSSFKAFYDGVFSDMSHHQHYISNFKPTAYDGDTATMWAYAHGFGRANDGNTVEVHVRYRMNFARVDGGWKITRYEIHGAMPLPGSLDEIHGDR